MEAEWKLAMLPCALFFSSHFSVIQKCRLFRNSFPMLPDVLSICVARAATQRAKLQCEPACASSLISWHPTAQLA